MIYLQLFWEFFKIGLFAVGGGMATLPFLQRLSERSGWFSQNLITDMIAVSESTPGPIGINMATYVGCNVAGVLGGVAATIGTILPSIIIVVTVSRYLERFRGSRLAGDVFYGLRPAVTGLIAAAGLGVAQGCLLHLDIYRQTGALLELFDFKRLVCFGAAFGAIRWFKLHPIVYIACAAVVGLLAF